MSPPTLSTILIYNDSNYLFYKWGLQLSIIIIKNH